MDILLQDTGGDLENFSKAFKKNPCMCLNLFISALIIILLLIITLHINWSFSYFFSIVTHPEFKEEIDLIFESCTYVILLV